MKIYRILVAVVLCAATGFFCYQFFVTKELAGLDIAKALLILLGLLSSLIAPKQRKPLKNKKALYQKSYSDFIRNAFSYDAKLERKFYQAVDDFNACRYDKCLQRLADLRKNCQGSDDIYAVTVFIALCYDRAGMFQAAAEHYERAMALRPHRTLASNLGVCYDQLGLVDKALAAFERSIALDDKNPLVYNNLAGLHFRQGAYDVALEYAEAAIKLNSTLPQALSVAAICCGVLDRQEEYENYYRRAVTCGYDGATIKRVLCNIKSSE